MGYGAAGTISAHGVMGPGGSARDAVMDHASFIHRSISPEYSPFFSSPTIPPVTPLRATAPEMPSVLLV